jgi:pimeloyl-ACP methyl ester carboxylesterase
MTSLAVLVSALALAANSPGAPPVSQGCGTSAPTLRTAWLRTSDGERIYVAELGRGTRGVVVGHEYGSSMCEWLSTANELADAGFHVLLVDFRGFGLSPRPRARPWNLPADLATAAAELRRRGAKRIALLGGSMGGTAAIVAGATLRPALSAVVCVSGGGDLADFLSGPHGPVDATRQAARLRVPLLVMAARDDPSIPKGYYASLMSRVPARVKQLALYPGVAHASDLLETNASARKRLVAFLRAHD